MLHVLHIIFDNLTTEVKTM